MKSHFGIYESQSGPDRSSRHKLLSVIVGAMYMHMQMIQIHI